MPSASVIKNFLSGLKGLNWSQLMVVVLAMELLVIVFLQVKVLDFQEAHARICSEEFKQHNANLLAISHEENRATERYADQQIELLRLSQESERLKVEELRLGLEVAKFASAMKGQPKHSVLVGPVRGNEAVSEPK